MSDSLLDLPTRPVLRTFKVAIDRHTINTLTTLINEEWRKTELGRPERVQYIRGESLLIERWTTAPAAPDGLTAMLAPYQAIRSLSEIALMGEQKSPLVAICMASEKLYSLGIPTRLLVCRDLTVFRRWLSEDLDIGRVLGIRVVEDPELPSGVRCFVCGSATSDMLHDIEYSICIQKEPS